MERTYTVPLRSGWLKAPKYRRAKKAINTLREFLVRHMKSEDVRILPDLNRAVWTNGIKRPPPRIKITAVKDDKGVVKAQLFGKPMPEEVTEAPKKGLFKKAAEKLGVKAEEKKPEAKPAETKAPEPKAEEKPVESKPEAPKVEEKKEESKAEEKPAAEENKPEAEEKPVEKKEAKPEQTS